MEIAFGKENFNELGTFSRIQVAVLPKVLYEQNSLLQGLEIRCLDGVELVRDMSLINAEETRVDKTEIVDPYVV